MGVVWIAGDVGLNDLIVFWGYWDSGSALLEQMPEVGSALLRSLLPAGSTPVIANSHLCMSGISANASS